jgi:membrane protease YdiL (CAAX protease family)
LFIGIVSFLPYLITSGGIIWLLASVFPSFNADQQQDIGFNNPSGAFQLTLSFLALAVFTPIAEEVLARGLLYSSFRKIMPAVFAAISSGLIFAGAHLFEGSGSSMILDLSN